MKVWAMIALVWMLGFEKSTGFGQNHNAAVSNYEQGLKALQSGAYAEADKKLCDALKLLPDRPDLLLGIGLARVKNQEYERAVAPLTSAAKSANETLASLALATLGEALLGQEKLQEAEVALNEALTKDNGNEVAKRTLARCYFDQGRHKLAIPLLSGLAGSHPGDFDLVTGLACAYIGAGQIVPARKYAEQAEDLKPGDPLALYNLSIVLAQSGAIDEAAAKLDPLVTAGNATTPALKNLAILKMIQGRGEEAASLLQQVIAVSPDDAEARQLLSEASSSGGALP